MSERGRDGGRVRKEGRSSYWCVWRWKEREGENGREGVEGDEEGGEGGRIKEEGERVLMEEEEGR